MFKRRYEKMKEKNYTKKIVVSAMLAAIVCVVTMVIKIPSPLKGYINIGDCVIIIVGCMMLSGYRFLAMGIGSAMADLLSGYVVYVPATFLIKGIMVLVVYYGFKLLHKRCGKLLACIISGVAAEIVMSLGYFIFEGFLYGFGPSLVNIPANAIQGIASIIIGCVVVKLFEKSKINVEA